MLRDIDSISSRIYIFISFMIETVSKENTSKGFFMKIYFDFDILNMKNI